MYLQLRHPWFIIYIIFVHHRPIDTTDIGYYFCQVFFFLVIADLQKV